MGKIEKLEKLADLKAKGVLNEKEFQKAKDAVLAEPDDFNAPVAKNATSPVPGGLACNFKCSHCSYKGRMNYVKFRMAPSFWLYFFLIFPPVFYITMYVSFLFGLLLALGIGFFVRQVVDPVAEIDTYACPKCGNVHEVPLKNGQVSDLRQHNLYHKNP